MGFGPTLQTLAHDLDGLVLRQLEGGEVDVRHVALDVLGPVEACRLGLVDGARATGRRFMVAPSEVCLPTLSTLTSAQLALTEIGVLFPLPCPAPTAFHPSGSGGSVQPNSQRPSLGETLTHSADFRFPKSSCQ